MAITFSCNHCGKSLTTSDDKAGRKAKCPGCGEVLTVPELEHAESHASLDDDSDSDADLEAGELPEAPPPVRKKSSRAKTGTKTCPMCGAENPRRARTCDACGEEFEEADERERHYERGHDIIEIGDVISATWRIFQQNLWVLVGAAMICVGIALVVYGGFVVLAIAIMASLNGQGNRQQAELVINLISLPFGLIAGVGVAYLNSGVNRLLLAVARGEEATVGMMFSGGRFTLRAFLIGLLYQMMTTMGVYCCIVPGIILSLMFWPYLYLIVDEDLPGIESLTKAKDVTAKNWLSVFVLGLVTGSIGTIGALTCIGLPFAMAFGWLTFAVAYCKMTGQRTAE